MKRYISPSIIIMAVIFNIPEKLITTSSQPSNASGRKGGKGCWPKWTTSDGGGVGHQPDVQKKKKFRKKIVGQIFFVGVSVVRIGVRHPLPPWIAIYFGPDRNIFCVSDVFTLDTVQTSDKVGGGCLQNGRCWTDQFLVGRLWWMTP